MAEGGQNTKHRRAIASSKAGAPAACGHDCSISEAGAGTPTRPPRAAAVIHRLGCSASVRPSRRRSTSSSVVCRCGEIRSDGPRTAAKQLNVASAEIALARALSGRRTPSRWGPRCSSGMGSNPSPAAPRAISEVRPPGSRPRAAPANRRAVRAQRSPSGGARTLCADRHRSAVPLEQQQSTSTTTTPRVSRKPGQVHQAELRCDLDATL